MQQADMVASKHRDACVKHYAHGNQHPDPSCAEMLEEPPEVQPNRESAPERCASNQIKEHRWFAVFAFPRTTLSRAERSRVLRD